MTKNKKTAKRRAFSRELTAILSERLSSLAPAEQDAAIKAFEEKVIRISRRRASSSKAQRPSRTPANRRALSVG